MSHGIFIFPREISLFSLGKMKIPWEISVPKLALIEEKEGEDRKMNLYQFGLNWRKEWMLEEKGRERNLCCLYRLSMENQPL
jgi:hypothetical protein